MKKKFFIALDDVNLPISLEIFEGSQEQANVYFKMRFGEFNQTRELKRTREEDVDFEGNIEEIDVHNKSKEVTLINRLNIDDAEENQFISNIGQVSVKLEELILFSNFELKTKCSKCFGTGTYTVIQNCGVPDSECCGGCTEVVDCDDHEVQFDLNL